MNAVTEEAGVAHAAAPRLLVIDTSVVLDLFLFQDPRTPELARAIRAGEVRWLATPR